MRFGVVVVKNSIPWIKIAILSAALMLSVDAFAATFYQPEAPVEVMTEMTVADIPGNPSVSRLTVAPAQKSKNAVYVDIVNANSGEAIDRLDFLENQRIVWHGASSTAKQLQANGLLIVPGISIPVDVLPVKQLLEGGEPEIFEIQRSAHGRTFLDRIRVAAIPVNSDQARQSQWIKIEGNMPEPLYMIEATDANGVLVVKQLWTPSSVWWLYEETPFRRSWRVQ